MTKPAARYRVSSERAEIVSTDEPRGQALHPQHVDQHPGKIPAGTLSCVESGLRRPDVFFLANDVAPLAVNLGRQRVQVGDRVVRRRGEEAVGEFTQLRLEVGL